MEKKPATVTPINGGTYDPYTYLPMQRAFFMTGNFSTLPDTAAKIAVEQPGLADHINSIWSFLSWMKSSNAPLYNIIANKRPDLVDPAAVVTSGALSVSKNITPKASKLKGYETDLTIGDTPSGSNPIVTSWGQDVLDLIKGIAPSYFQIKSQSDLMKINIARAEQGLPPIDSSGLAPTVNVGISPAVQQMGYLAVGGLVLVGLVAAFKRAR